MTSKSLIGCIRYLLSQGVKYVFSENFCQDDLENHFGKQRSIGHRKDNPNVHTFLQNENIIKSTISVDPIGGNVLRGPQKWNNITTEPLPKRKKASKPKLYKTAE